MLDTDFILKILGRQNTIFNEDLDRHSPELNRIIKASRFLVIGGAGSIGQAVVKEIFSRNPQLLHVVDISENSMVELVRDLRSTLGYTSGEFRTFSIDCGGVEFAAMCKVHGPYDYVFNLSALKHVRSERDQFTLMRMIEVNILNTMKSLEICKEGLEKYFCVSTDKAANPVNLMGASKRVMEMFLFDASEEVDISTARFANVAFSNGSLPDSFLRRFELQQPLSAPIDVLRYFVTAKEAGELCLMSGLLGKNNEIYFPNNNNLTPTSFSDLAVRFLESKGFEAYRCNSEEEARERAGQLIASNRWPVYLSSSDTTGEKPCEEFYTNSEKVELNRYKSIGIVKNSQSIGKKVLDGFISDIQSMRSKHWTKMDLVDLFRELLPDLSYTDMGKYLDDKM